MRGQLLPVILIVIGGIWLLRIFDILPSTATMFSIILSAIFVFGGVAILLTDGINKQTIVSAPTLIYIGVVVYLRSQYYIYLPIFIASGMILIGFLLLLSRSTLITNKPKIPTK